MNKRRLRVGMLLMCLIIAIGAVSAAVLSGLGRGEATTRSQSVEKDVDESTSLPDEEIMEPIPGPFVRKPPPRAPGFVPVPIAVEIGHELQPVGPNDKDERTYAEVAMQTLAADQAHVRIGTTNGYGGVTADVMLDLKARSAQITVVDWCHIWPEPRPWSEVNGTVRLTSWSQRAGTLFEIDLHGKTEEWEGNLRLCAPLEARAYVPVR
jgi:hypothetical protein